MANRLARQSSPYLRQHAGNPVDWYPWGPEALEKAKSEDKPIFLSIGYAACHWCHVMERESFENPATAELLNSRFVPVKVDREERPDLDAIYMQAVIAMTGQGGWPMSVWLTPDQVPFYGGTYFPPEARHGLPSFNQVLESVAQAWHTKREAIAGNASRMLEIVSPAADSGSADPGGETAELQDATGGIVELLAKSFDKVYGGWGGAPKFPPAMLLEYLLRPASRGDTAAREMVEKTLDAMSRGGIHDQLGGGFHRYATDGRWLVPHFEKMLYDNAQLARAYLHAYQLSGNDEWRRVACATLDYLLREMRHPEGGFFSSQDADSEGVEGKYFVWDLTEVSQLLGDETRLFAAVYDVSQGGNWEGRNVLNMPRTIAEAADRFELPLSDLSNRMARARLRLLERRQTRVPPPRDEKVLTAWNGMAMAALAEAGDILEEPRYLDAAVANASFLLTTLRDERGHLLRSWHEGYGGALTGYLEDYANLIDGLLSLYQATFDDRWYLEAKELTDSVLQRFDSGTWFYDTSEDHERLLVRPRELYDNAVPSGNALMATVLGKMAALSGDSGWSERARKMVTAMQPAFSRQPGAFGQWLQAYDMCLRPPIEVALVGNPASSQFREMRHAVKEGYRPRLMVAGGLPGSTTVPLLAGRDATDRATAYVCEGFVCQLPARDVATLRDQLAGKM